ncbi:Chaperone protein dnaJ 49, partial [Cucurbita argyrosperma subsp. sororia]
MNGEAEQKPEARRLRELAETKFRDSNLKSALKYAKRAHRLDPNLDGAAEILTSLQILRVAAGSPDEWYGILQVEPFAHINTIKKQYKKLALLLHPDKNPYAGSEEAFKLVNEAFRFLSDKVRRKEYDLKLRIRIQDEKIGDADAEVATESETFWTACSTCQLLHQFEKRYVGYNLVCPSCRKSFKAVEVVHNEPEIVENGHMVRGRRLRNLSSRQNSGSFQGLEPPSSRKKMSTTQSKRNSSVKKTSSEKEKGMEMNGKAVSVEDELRNGDLEEEHDSDDEIWSRRRLRSGSMRKKMSSVDEVLERSKLKPVKMEEEMMTLAELQSQVIRKARKEKMKLKLKEEEEAEERENKRKKGIEDGDDNDDDERLTLKEMEGLLRIRRQEASKRAGFPRNEKQRNLKKDVNLEIKKQGSSCDLDMMVEDSDFYDFDKDRMERSLKKGQVWAIYDDDDGMPRHYGLIEAVTVNPFEVKMSWLDVQNNGEERLLSWEKLGFHVSCGRFKVSKKTTIDSLNIFSHVVDCERAAKEVYRIYPKKGSVWALYKEQEALDAEKKRNVSSTKKRTYDIAVFLTTYSEMHGLSMAYLEKVDGYKTIFKRREIGYHAIRWFGKDDIQLFSHQIPARKLSVDEELGHLKDCWELDPASLPSDLVTTCKSR